MMDKTSTKLLIMITTAAIITMATTTSLSAAIPAFAKVNCKPANTPGTQICAGGSGCGFTGCSAGSSPSNSPGGGGSRQVIEGEGEDRTAVTFSGGGGGNIELPFGTEVGGRGGHFDEDSGRPPVGGSGQHLKGPGGNSGR
jgi:hypothetical protein